MNIRVIKIKGKNPGKTVSILAGVHGNETPGIKAVEKLFNIKIDKGTLYLILCNLEAIKQNKRFIEQNLNRCFLKKQPKNIRNSLEGKTAKEIMPYLDKSDVVLDLHASNTKDTQPFIICERQSFEIAKFLPAEIVISNLDKFETGSTDYYMNLRNKAGICIECGYILNKKSIVFAERAIKQLLKATELVNEIPAKQNKQKYTKICSLYKNKDGPFRKVKEFSDFEVVKNGTLIGLDGTNEIKVKKDALILFARNKDKIGEECFLLAKGTGLNKPIKYKKQKLQKLMKEKQK